MHSEKPAGMPDTQQVQMMNRLIGLIDEHFSCFSAQPSETGNDLRLIAEMGMDVTDELLKFIEVLRVEHEKKAFDGLFEG